ncbi:BREX-1 system adenine-specific DNA-methyltransferase PglX [Vibrio vulnificus]|nr:hypothetical protein [Vibrio vulnificus]MCU8184347.1 BREX-1 system adenine-specific DNA-methyltransferase PglX [Vibrio vulnificus]
MTTFFRLLDIADKETPLKVQVANYCSGKVSDLTFDVNPEDFSHVPGSPFSYWTSNSVRFSFKKFHSLESDTRTAKQGLASGDDFRFVRLSWEVADEKWVDFAKGGQYSPHYADIYLKINWDKEGGEIKNLLNESGKLASRPQAIGYYGRPGLTWPRRTTSGLSIRPMASGCIFADKGPAIFVENDEPEKLLALQSIISSAAFTYLLGIQLAAADSAARSYEVGLMQQTPIPALSDEDTLFLSYRAQRAWELKYQLDSINETSHAFYLPEILQNRLGTLEVEHIVEEYNTLIVEIDKYCFRLFNFNESDELAAKAQQTDVLLSVSDSVQGDEKQLNGLISWAVGVVFGRFSANKYLNNLQHTVPSSPFSELPSSLEVSGGATQGREFFVGESSVQNCLAESVKQVLASIGVEISLDIQSWLSKDFFSHHISEYTQSRRVAPIYWKLESLAGTCSVWLYINNITGQTIYKVVNDYLLPKLKGIEDKIEIISANRNRTANEEKELSALIESRDDIQHFRHELLNIANFWIPNLNDGVQITAAPLWRLFQHKPWQKKLKQTWEELEDGDYDWAHLAYTTWPERVLKKCLTDRSIAIAHGVETDLWHEVEIFKGKKKEPVWEWQPKPMSPSELNDYVREKIATDERLALYRSNAKNSGVK